MLECAAFGLACRRYAGRRSRDPGEAALEIVGTGEDVRLSKEHDAHLRWPLERGAPRLARAPRTARLLAASAIRDRADGSLATACALLPAPPPIGDRPQVHGRLRAARGDPTGHHAGRRRGASQIDINPARIAGMKSRATARRTSRSSGSGRTVVKSVNPSARCRRTNSR